MKTLRSRSWHTLAHAILVACLAASAYGQGLYLNEDYDVQLVTPPGWLFADSIDGEGNLILQLQAPGDAGFVVLVATPIGEAERAYWRGPLDELLTDVWGGFEAEVDGARLLRRFDLTSGGRTFRALDYQGSAVVGTLLLHVGSATAFTFVSVAEPQAETLATVQAGLEAILESFAPARVELPDPLPWTPPSNGGVNPLDPRRGVNPLDPPRGVNPLDPDPPVNPLDPPGGTNPLDPPDRTNPLDPPYGAGEAFAGVFVGDRVRLELATSGDGLVGTLAIDGIRYPARAQQVGEGLEGSFEAAGVAYPFTVDRRGDGLVLASGGASFDLRPER